MEFKTLKGISTKEITQVFNEAFSDYFIPLNFTEEQLKSKMVADKTDLSLSVGVFEKGNLVAFILHGFDIIDNQKMVYNGGTGVVHEKRGAGLTKQMYQYIIPLLIVNGIDRIILEVIDKNIQAIKSYEKSGFKTKRHLACYKGKIEISNTNANVEIKELKNYNWQLMESFWDVSPTWQNSIPVVNEIISTNASLGAYVKNQLVGYVIYNPNNNRIQQIAVQKGYRNKRIASTLIVKLKERFGNKLSIINVDKRSSAVNDFFNKIGLKNSLEQIEMEMILGNDNQ
ncbi:GNAT family N-acetyltransferase [Winogradskyella sp. A2]|uniref:GNAT family N-acetyltransferase n=1 Tax=Winogradskyella sp. A2 TaxID=3366944 RepID=UPI00398C328C